jgi:hypothetical protein
MLQNYNPFQRQELVLPEEARSAVDRVVRQRVKESKPHNQPFRRTVDFWFACVILGARELAGDDSDIPTVSRDDGWHFVAGSIFEGDPHRIEMLELIAIGISNDPYVIQDPQKIIRWANGLCKLGFPKLMLELEGDGKRLDDLMSFYRQELSAASSTDA